jgi:hypothetical protein
MVPRGDLLCQTVPASFLTGSGKQQSQPTESFAAWIRALESAQASSGQDAVFPGLGLTPVPIESSPKSKKEAREA